MATKKILLLSMISILFFSSCKKSSYETPIIDFKSFNDKVDLSLSDLMTNVRVVPMETRDDLLLSSDLPVSVSEKHIIASTGTEIHQFDKNGKHIRVLAVEGNGPNEFSQVIGFMIDDKNDILYYKDFDSQEVIKRLNLKTGEHLAPFELEEKAFFTETVDKDGVLYGFNAPMYVFSFNDDTEGNSGGSVLFSLYDPQNDAMKEINTYHPYFSTGASKSMLSLGKNVFLTNLSYGDTLFSYQSNGLNARAIFKFDNKMTNIMTGGEGITLSFINSEGVIFQKTNTGLEEGVDGAGRRTLSIATHTTHNVFLSSKGEVNLIRSLYIDPFGFKENLQKEDGGDSEGENGINIGLPNYCSGYGFYALDAIEYIQLLEHALGSKDVPEKKKEEYRKQLSEIDEESNPILIIGKVK